MERGFPGGKRVHNIMRVRVCAAHIGGRGGCWTLDSLNKGQFLGRFSLYMGGFGRNWQKKQ